MDSITVDDLTALILHETILAHHHRDIAETCSKDENLKPLEAGFRKLANQHDVGASMYRYIGQRLADRRTIEQMKSEVKQVEEKNVSKRNGIWTVLLFLLVMFLLTSGTVMVAQGSTQEVTEVTIEPTKAVVSPPGDIVVVPGDDSGQTIVIRQDDALRPIHWILIGVIVLLALLLGTQNQTLVKPALLEIAKNVSPAVLEIALGAARSGLDQAGRFVEVTETKIDDAAFEELKRGYEQLEREMREIKALAYRARDNPTDGLG